MTWFKVDDRFHSHPKVVALPLDALGLWTRCGSYCAQHPKLSGVVSLEIATQFSGSKSRARALIAKLLTAGLWIECEGGWRFHDWLEFNPSAEEVAERRVKRAVAGQLGGQRSAEQRASKLPATSKQVASTETETCSKQNSTLSRSRSRPDPDPDPREKSESERAAESPAAHSAPESGTRPISSAGKVARSAKTELPSDFSVSPAIDAMCRAERLPDPHVVILDFRDKALAKSYRYADWEAAFRTWMRSRITRENYPVWESSRSVTAQETPEQAEARAAANWERDKVRYGIVDVPVSGVVDVGSLFADLGAAKRIGGQDASGADSVRPQRSEETEPVKRNVAQVAAK